MEKNELVERARKAMFYRSEYDRQHDPTLRQRELLRQEFLDTISSFQGAIQYYRRKRYQALKRGAFGTAAKYQATLNDRIRHYDVYVYSFHTNKKLAAYGNVTPWIAIQYKSPQQLRKEYTQRRNMDPEVRARKIAYNKARNEQMREAVKEFTKNPDSRWRLETYVTISLGIKPTTNTPLY